MSKRKSNEYLAAPGWPTAELRGAPATWNPNAGNPAPAQPWNPNSSPEYWSITGPDGVEVSLHQWGWSVTTVGGSRYDLPPKRGSDMTMAYRPGQIHRRKVPDARPITLVMFMVGFDPSTGDAPPDQRLQWNDNWDTLRRLVYRHSLLGDQRVRLTRRWFLTAPEFPGSRVGDGITQHDLGVPPSGQSRLLSAFAFAEMTGQMTPSMTGRFRSDFQLDFMLADPYFYGSTVNARLDMNNPVYLWNDGHDVAGPGYMEVELNGPLQNPRITNLSTNPDSWVQYNGSIAAGDKVRMVVSRFTCEKVLPGGNQNRIQYVSNYGSRWWVSLLPGTNKLNLTNGNDSDDGWATVSFRPPYV